MSSIDQVALEPGGAAETGGNAAGGGQGVLIDDAFFAEVREGDLANLRNKVLGGKSLTNRERELLEQERALRTKNPSSAFTLEGEGPNALDRMTQKELAEAWGVSLRSVKGWMAVGKEKNDPCPLTRPVDMAAWYARMHAPRQCPEKLVLAAHRILAGVETKGGVEAVTVPAGPVERVQIDERSKGMLAMLDRHREAEATLHAKYMAAVDAGDEVKSSFLLSEWSKMGEKLRQVEKMAPAALEAIGVYVKRDEVQRALEPVHAAVIKGFRQGLRMCRPRLKAAGTAEEWNQVADEIVDEVCAMLAATDFAEPLVLDDAA